MYCIQVVHKTQEMHINKSDAIFEVYTDRIVAEMQDCSKALLGIVKISAKKISEFCVRMYTAACETQVVYKVTTYVQQM